MKKYNQARKRLRKFFASLIDDYFKSDTLIEEKDPVLRSKLRKKIEAETETYLQGITFFGYDLVTYGSVVESIIEEAVNPSSWIDD